MDISIVIPNFNGAKLLEKNIPKVFDSLKEYTQKTKTKGEVIIVDDASSDSSVSVIKKLCTKYSDLIFLENERNFGFSSTINKGVKHAKGDIVILFNSDVIPEKIACNF